MTMLNLTAADGFTLKAYRAAPVGPRKGGLVLIMEIFGVTAHIKSLADHFAAEGYEVLAPQLYDRVARDFVAGYGPEDIQAGLRHRQAISWDQNVLDLQASIDALKGQGKVGMLGFCYGGSMSFLAAGRCSDLAAASGYYGSSIKDMLELTPRCPTILHFGERDHGIPLDVVAAISEAQPGVPCYLYPADHGFVSDRPQNHDAASTTLAHRRTLRLFQQYVAG